MTKGFYVYNYNVYYGDYCEEQVSGKWKISSFPPERIKTNQHIGEEDWAVKFQDNHAMLEEEYEVLQKILLQMKCFMSLNEDVKMDFSETEKRLGISIPKELKEIYKAIHKREEYFNAQEHFLPLEEIYVEDDICVFFKKKRTPLAGYDLKSGCLAIYYKKEWIVEVGDMCCYQYCLSKMVVIAIENRPVVKKGRCKGDFVTTLNIQRELEQFCNEQYHLLTELRIYGIATMYSEEGTIAWIRSNGLYADIYAGAMEETHLEALGEHLKNVVWK